MINAIITKAHGRNVLKDIREKLADPQNGYVAVVLMKQGSKIEPSEREDFFKLLKNILSKKEIKLFKNHQIVWLALSNDVYSPTWRWITGDDPNAQLEDGVYSICYLRRAELAAL